MGFLDGSGQRPHPEEPAALRARARRDYQANVGLGQDFAIVGGWLAAALRRPFGFVARLVSRDQGGSP